MNTTRTRLASRLFTAAHAAGKDSEELTEDLVMIADESLLRDLIKSYEDLANETRVESDAQME